jgi:O-antigen/teichoic acid export membrane protein
MFMADNKKKKGSVASGLFWSFGERITAQLVTLIVTVVLARLLDPEQYAVVAIVSILITIANAFVTGGFGNSLIQKKDADDLDFSSLAIFSFCFSILLYIILFFVAPLISRFYGIDQLTAIIRVMGIRIIIASINTIQHAYVSKQMAFRKFFVSTLFGTIVSGFVGVLMAYLGFGLWSLVWQYLTNVSIDTIVLFFTCGWKPSIKFSFERVKKLFSFGWKLLMAEVLTTVYNELRGLVLSKGFPATELSYYNQGKKYPALFNNNIEVSVNKVLFQKLSDEQDDLRKVKKITSLTVSLSAFLLFPLYVGMMGCARSLVLVLLTEKWLPCVEYLRIACLIFMIEPLITSVTRTLKSIGQGGLFLFLVVFRYTVGALLIFLSFILFHEPHVVVFSGFVAMFIMWVVGVCINQKMIKYSVLEQIADFIRPLIICIIMFILLMFIEKLNIGVWATLTVQFLVGVFSYVGLSFIFNRRMALPVLNYIKNLINKGRSKEV